jgi:hypothetical protein
VSDRFKDAFAVGDTADRIHAAEACRFVGMARGV